MEVKFDKNTIPCLRKVVSQLQNQEQTQEVRLSEAMPDIGRVLCSWGQVLVRSKEWRNGAMSINAGVQTWTLYAPEDGSQVRSVEAWIPFQMRWELPDTERDGAICVVPILKSVDARSTSARKLMVRINVSVLGEAHEPIMQEIPFATDMPKDIQLLKNSYPVTLPLEAGEKTVSVDEELELSNELQQLEKILYYSMTPELVEQKVMAGRVVFRGNAQLRVTYCTGDGEMHTWNYSIPFSQFAELDRDYSTAATADICMLLTGLELDRIEENKLVIKASMTAQYRIYDRLVLDVVQDAYSPCRCVSCELQQCNVPILLDTCNQILHLSQTIQLDATQIISTAFTTEHPQYYLDGNGVAITIPGQFHVMYSDKENNLQCVSVKAESTCNLLSDAQNIPNAFICETKNVGAVLVGDSLELNADATLEVRVFTETGLSMVEALTMGEVVKPDPNRPSLVLCRGEMLSLWEIAKACGSTVESIQMANHLDGEPENGQMLLIPIA